MEMILKWVQTTALTTVSKLLYFSFIGLIKDTWFIYFCSKLIFYPYKVYKFAPKCLKLHKCSSKIPSVPHKCRKVKFSSQWPTHALVCRSPGWLLTFYLLKRHDCWIPSFPKLCTLIRFILGNQHIWIKWWK